MNWNPFTIILDSVGKLMGAAKVLKVGQLIVISLLVVTLFGMFTINSAINHHNPSPETEKARFAKSLTVNREVQAMLDEGRIRANADRFVVRQFHNGQKDLSGIPFTFIKTTAASVKSSVSEPSSMYQDYPTTTVSELLYQMFTSNKCVTLDIENMRDQGLRKMLLELGTQRMMACPMYNSMRYPVGYIAFGYVDRNAQRPSDEELYKLMIEDADAIATMLTSVTEGESPKSLVDTVKDLF